ncbi:uncharacterized protein L201_005786 [Kwoniella dendrophila CBS 6074]|uniref:Uncharacterized protein n=1 Tax=Kwoniella dendrophila CBS 6074 TaxID=1295534 RepID=A0AAX4K142_9TREE
MPNFLKSIFKPTPTQSPGQTRRGSDDIGIYDRRRSSTDAVLAELLRTELRSSEGESTRGYNKDTISDLVHRLKNDDQTQVDEKSMNRLFRILEDIEAEDEILNLNQHTKKPNDNVMMGNEQLQSSTHRSSTSVDPATIGGHLLSTVIEGNSEAIEIAEKLLETDRGELSNAPLLERVISLLDAQKNDLDQINPYTGRQRYPALVTLEQIYERVRIDLKGVKGMSENDDHCILIASLKKLQEGPDYLIDIILVTTIVHQSSIISIPLSIDIKDLLDKAVNDHSDLILFRQSLQDIISLYSSLNGDVVVEDRESEDAFGKMSIMIKQLQSRISYSNLSTPFSSLPNSRNPSTCSSVNTVTPTPIGLPGSPSSLLSSSKSSPPSLTYNQMPMDELQKQYGTGDTTIKEGQLPGLSSYRETTEPYTSVPKSKVVTKEEKGDEDEEEEGEVWEYRGQLLTASALDLVLREEMLLQADSSNQYSGQVTYDDLRKCYIPKHIQKLKIPDLTDPENGEIPDTTPSGFKLKTEDEWGNKIGWYDNGSGVKEMYYLEEPKFELD